MTQHRALGHGVNVEDSRREDGLLLLLLPLLHHVHHIAVRVHYLNTGSGPHCGLLLQSKPELLLLLLHHCPPILVPNISESFFWGSWLAGDRSLGLNMKT